MAEIISFDDILSAYDKAKLKRYYVDQLTIFGFLFYFLFVAYFSYTYGMASVVSSWSFMISVVCAVGILFWRPLEIDVPSYALLIDGIPAGFFYPHDSRLGYWVSEEAFISSVGYERKGTNITLEYIGQVRTLLRRNTMNKLALDKIGDTFVPGKLQFIRFSDGRYSINRLKK